MSKVINQIKILFFTPALGLYNTAYVAFVRNYNYLSIWLNKLLSRVYNF